MITSANTEKIFPALIKAQSEIETVLKKSDNPYFKSKYADLPSIQAMLKPILTAHGLGVVQAPGATKMIGETSMSLALSTRLIHESGEWIEETLELPIAKADPQGAGSAITYGRRYALAAMFNISVDGDDDGNSASGHRGAPMPRVMTHAPTAAREHTEAPSSQHKASDRNLTKVQIYAERIEAAHDLHELASLAASGQKDLTRAERDELLPVFTRVQRILKGVNTVSSEEPSPASDERRTEVAGVNPTPWAIQDGVPHCGKHPKYPMKPKTGTGKNGKTWTRFFCSAKDPNGKNGYCEVGGFDNEIFG
jgi:hypothetical protein